MSKAFEDLAAQVAATETVVASAVQLIQGFSAQLAAAGTDANKLEQLKIDLAASTATLATAVAANTAQAPAQSPEPVAPPAPAPSPEPDPVVSVA